MGIILFIEYLQVMEPLERKMYFALPTDWDPYLDGPTDQRLNSNGMASVYRQDT